MFCAITRLDLLILLILGYFIYDLVANWQDYRFCHAPISIFLLLTYCANVLQVFIWSFVSHRNTRRLLRRFVVSIFLLAALAPLLAYLIAQGLIWQIQNIKETPSCIPSERIPWLVWGWIFILICEDLIYFGLTIVAIVSWRKFVQERQRIREIVANTQNLEGRGLNQYLLGLNDDFGDMRDRIGLSLNDVDNLETKVYEQNIINVFDFNQNSCSICLAEFKNEDITTALPKCKHIFHSECVNAWLLKNPLCPICRSNVRTDFFSNNAINEVADETYTV